MRTPFIVILIVGICYLLYSLLKWLSKGTLKAAGCIFAGAIIGFMYIIRLMMYIVVMFTVVGVMTGICAWVGNLFGDTGQGIGLLIGLVSGFYIWSKVAKEVGNFLENIFDKFI